VQILIADDDALVRRFLADGLQKLGHDVVPAIDGEQAWSLCEAVHFPVIVTDWKMPGLDGLELCRRVRAVSREKYSYIIVLTGVQGRSEFLEAMDSGVDDFLTKPVDLERLAVRIRVAERILGLQRQVRQLQSLLPVCAYCHRIRGEYDRWESMERVLEQRTGSELSHGICPDCVAQQIAANPVPVKTGEG
jgi:sigma-B regulation protein RsbU (phosphoserine phosphatase)